MFALPLLALSLAFAGSDFAPMSVPNPVLALAVVEKVEREGQLNTASGSAMQIRTLGDACVGYFPNAIIAKGTMQSSILAMSGRPVIYASITVVGSRGGFVTFDFTDYGADGIVDMTNYQSPSQTTETYNKVLQCYMNYVFVPPTSSLDYR